MHASLKCFLALACLVVTAVSAVAESEQFPMRWRVFCDYQNNISFRYPYHYFIPDQYVGGLVRGRSIRQEIVGREIEIDGKKVFVFEKPTDTATAQYDVKASGVLTSTLPSEVLREGLPGVGDWFVKSAGLGGSANDQMSWTSYNYYSVDGRPHGDPKWAPPAVEAMLGQAAGSCALVLKHGDRHSAIVLTGEIDDKENKRIIDSFEIMAPKGKDFSTWREDSFKRGFVINSEGKPLKAPEGKVDSVGWARAWEIETKHYHVTSHVSPAKLRYYGAYLEALYKCFANVYNPDLIPPFKMEIHVFNTFRDFQEGAASQGIPVGPGTGGFFVPSLLSIFAFQVMPEYFSNDFNVEKVLAHECSHQFLHCTCNGSDHVPTWINEGLAVYFESGKFQNGSLVWYPPTERVNILKSFYGQDRRTLWALDNYLKHYGHIGAEQYGEVYAMTHFWIFGAKGGKDRFKQYWNALKKRENGSEAFERIFMADMIKAAGSRDQAVERWQKAMLEYVKTLK